MDFSDLTALVREIALSHFKCKILAATRARTLKPTEKDFANLIHNVHRTKFFDNVMYAINDIFSTNYNHNFPNVIEPTSGRMVDNTLLVAQNASKDRHGGLAVQNVSEILQNSSLSCSSQNSPEIRSNRRRSRRPAQILDYRKIILRNISKTVQCYSLEQIYLPLSVYTFILYNVGTG